MNSTIHSHVSLPPPPTHSFFVDVDEDMLIIYLKRIKLLNIRFLKKKIFTKIKYDTKTIIK